MHKRIFGAALIPMGQYGRPPWMFGNLHTVNFTYSEHGYSELPGIRNNLFWPEFCPSLFNIKIYGYSEHGYKESSLIRNSFLSPNWVKSAENYTFMTNSNISASTRKFQLSFSLARIKTRGMYRLLLYVLQYIYENEFV
jgi:hypothetical protein